MKHIKSLLTMLLLGLSFTACNEYDDFDKEANTVNYPSREAISLGHYSSTYTANSDYEYDVLLTQNTLGDTVMYVLMTGKENTDEAGKVRTIAVADGVEYNQELGMLTGVASEEASHFEEETSVTMAYKADLKTITLSLKYGDTMVATHVSKTDAKPAPYGTFYGVPEGAESSDYVIGFAIYQEMLLLESAGIEYNAVIASAQGSEPAIHTIEGDVVTITGLATSSVYTLAYNDICQMVATDAAGQKYICDGERSEPEPEDYAPYAVGRYIHGVKGSVFSEYFGQAFANVLGANLPNSSYEATLYQSTRKANRFAIDPWCQGVEPLFFSVDNETGLITVPGSSTGFSGNVGGIMAVDCYSLLGELPSLYDEEAGVFDFYHCLFDGQYIYGIDNDQYVITGEASGVQKKNLTKGGKTLGEKRAKHTLTIKKR